MTKKFTKYYSARCSCGKVVETFVQELEENQILEAVECDSCGMVQAYMNCSEEGGF